MKQEIWGIVCTMLLYATYSTQITIAAPYNSIYTGQMLLLMPNVTCHSTSAKKGGVALLEKVIRNRLYHTTVIARI